MTASPAGRSRDGDPPADRPTDRTHVSGSPERTDVVTCFLRHRAEVLLVRRSRRVGSYRGRWGAVAGHVETEDPLQDARREVEEETGLGDALTLARRGEAFAVDDRDTGRRWRVHPFLFDVARRDAVLDWEAVEGVWVPPTAILERPCVPRLWTSYARVAPTLETVRADREHGSAYLSLRALEVLRDRAAATAAGVDVPGVLAPGVGVAGAAAPDDARPAGDGRAGAPAGGGVAEREGDALRALARALRDAQPAMTALRNRIDRAMSAASTARASVDGAVGEVPGADRAGPLAVAAAAQDVLEGALRAEDAVAAEAAGLVAGRRVLTLSLSGTLAQALLAAAPAPAFVAVAESRPGGEGRMLAERLAARGIDVALVPDAAMAWALERFGLDLVAVGADTVLPGGDVVNKVGTQVAALAARQRGTPFVAVAARDKIAPEGSRWEASAAAEGDGAVDGGAPHGEPAASALWRSPLFERTPAALVHALVTETGVLDAAGVRAAATEHARAGGWDR